MKKPLLAVALAAFGLLVLAAPAAAMPPQHTSFDFTDSFVDTEVCAAAPWQFDVTATEHGYGLVEVFFDANGDFVRGVVHLHLGFTISANGITLVERDLINIFFNANGRREVGLWTHIQGPGGLVLRDAGQLVFDADDNFLYARGPHPQFFGATFCPALTP
jgi:hypothetical protein